jgi:hypothetical protein
MANPRKYQLKVFYPIKLKNIDMSSTAVILLWEFLKWRNTENLKQNWHLKYLCFFFLEPEVGQNKNVKEIKRADFQIIFYLGGEEKKITGNFLNIGSVDILGLILV